MSQCLSSFLGTCPASGCVFFRIDFFGLRFPEGDIGRLKRLSVMTVVFPNFTFGIVYKLSCLVDMDVPDDWEDICVDTLNPINCTIAEQLEAETEAKSVRRTSGTSGTSRTSSTRSKKKRLYSRRYQKMLKMNLDGKHVVVEPKPVYTHHAQERVHQGRTGEYVTSRRGNRVVVITVLPRLAHQKGSRKQIPRLFEQRKQPKGKYKYR